MALPRAPRSRSRVALGLALVVLAGTSCKLANLEREEKKATELAQTSFLYAADGTLITPLHAGENRVVVPFRKIPQSIQQAVVAVEDRRFYQHQGIDVKAVLRAAYIDATTGRIVEGGSTITQQYVKNVFVGTERTLERKVKEAALAWQLEEKYTKDQILARYLNTVYFGEGAYGIEAAAKQFFSTRSRDLTLAQSALLAGLISAPADNNPFRHPRVAQRQRDLVLEQMREQGMISKRESSKATRSHLKLSPPPEDQVTLAPYFVDYFKDWFLSNPAFGEDVQERYNLLFRGGLRITTTVDPTLQRYADRAAHQVLPYRSDPYAAMTVLDPRTGYVRAMVGGRDYYAPRSEDHYSNINLATGGSTGRQAGSAFKPFALVAALENGISKNKVYSAPSQINIPLPDGQVWQVHNADLGSYSSLTLEQATINSVNTVYAQVIMDVGAEKVIEVAERMGIRCCTRTSSPSGGESGLDPNPSAVLGTNEVNTLEMASAFGTLAAGGLHVQPTPVINVRNAEGKVIWEAEEKPESVIDPSIASEVNDILQQAVTSGTGTNADLGRPQIGKTGTAQAYRDAMFIGSLPQLTAAVWVGFPQGQISMQAPRTRITVFGGTFPAQIWKAFMTQAIRVENLEPRNFPNENVRYISERVDITQECLPNRYTLPQNIETVEYIAGTQPTKTCRQPDSARQVTVPSVIGQAATDAKVELTEAGFYVDYRVVPSNQPAGTVIAQRPQAGLEARQTSTVQITISKANSQE
jgi:penicillin-binding protein 1A